MLYLLDRRGGLEAIPHDDGETVASALIRNGIPPASVLVYRNTDDSVVADYAALAVDNLYTARLIEGYDLQGIRRLYGEDLHGASPETSKSELYLKRRLAIAADGSMRMERHLLDPASAATHVEDTVFDTIERFELISPGDKVVLGLSGGVDSGSLLMLLSRYRSTRQDRPFSLVAATFQDFDSRDSEAFKYSSELAHRAGVDYRLLEAGLAEQVFNLGRPLAQILMLLMETDDAHQAMYVDHHTTRRVLEVFASDEGSNTVALGLHTTDLLAGLLNSWTSGYDMGGLPRRQVGEFNYLLPLMFVPKRELHLYYTTQVGHLPKQTIPNQWEFNPLDRNFYYFLADQMQWYWPGMQHWLLTAHAAQATAEPSFRSCQNCQASTREIVGAPAWSGLCDVCSLLDKHGWLRPG